MSTQNIRFHDQLKKNPERFVFMRYRKNFVGTQNRVRISHGKRAIGDRAIEVQLYLFLDLLMYYFKTRKTDCSQQDC